MLKKIFFHSLRKYIISVFIVIAIILIYNLINSGWKYLISYSNALFIGGVLLLAIGGLSFVDLHNGFDIFRYIFVRKEPDGTKIPLSEFQERQNEKNKFKQFRFMPYLVVGILALIAAFIILLCL